MMIRFSYSDPESMTVKEKFEKRFQLLKASVKKTTDCDVNKDYSADELEAFDALSDRFIRTVAVAIKFSGLMNIICRQNKARQYETDCTKWKR